MMVHCLLEQGSRYKWWQWRSDLWRSGFPDALPPKDNVTARTGHRGQARDVLCCLASLLLWHQVEM